MSISDEDVSDQRVKEKINDLRTKYPDISLPSWNGF